MKIVPLLLSPILFLVACCLPALEFSSSQGGNDVMWGANILAVGWSGIFAGVMGWYANPFWILGLVLGIFRKSWLAAGAGLIAIAIGCSTFTLFGQQIPGDEGNVTHLTLMHLLPGFYFWMASLVTFPIVAFFVKPKLQ